MIDEEKALKHFTYYLAHKDRGIYPQSIDGVKRTEWQDGWNAAIMKGTKKAIKISEWLKGLPEEVFELIVDETLYVCIGDEPELFINCNDLFFWACSDAEEFDFLLDLSDLKKALEESPEHGDILWVCRKRKMRPQKPYYKYFNKKEKKLFNACGPKRKD